MPILEADIDDKELNDLLAQTGELSPGIAACDRSRVDLIADASRRVCHQRGRQYYFLLQPKFLDLRERAEARSYRRQLLNPAAEDEMLQALMWFVERGNHEDLGALLRCRRCPVFSSEDIKNLFDRAEKKIVERIAREGVASGGSLLPRGSLNQAASGRLSGGEGLSEIAELLKSPDKETRCQAALALGEWGGEESAVEIANLLQSDEDEEVWLYCVTALGVIGGPVAVEGLSWAIEHGPEAVKRAAVNAAQELLAGGSLEDTESPLGQRQAPWNLMAQPSEEKRLAQALQQLRLDPNISEYLRIKADELLSEVARH